MASTHSRRAPRSFANTRLFRSELRYCNSGSLNASRASPENCTLVTEEYAHSSSGLGLSDAGASEIKCGLISEPTKVSDVHLLRSGFSGKMESTVSFVIFNAAADYNVSWKVVNNTGTVWTTHPKIAADSAASIEIRTLRSPLEVRAAWR